MLGAVVDTEVARFFSALAVRMGAAANLEDVLVAGMTEAATRVTEHPALKYLRAYEPELVLSQLAFARMDEVLSLTCAFTTPFLGRWLDQAEARRVAEWAARIVVSYLVCPAEGVDLTDARQVRRLVRMFVLPGVRALRVPHARRSQRAGDGWPRPRGRTISAVQPSKAHHQGGSIMTEQMRETADIIGRDEVNDLEAILSVVNTDVDEERHAVHSVYDTIFTWDYEKGQRPKLEQALRKGQEDPVERPDRPSLGDRGRPGEARGGQRRRQRRLRATASTSAGTSARAAGATRSGSSSASRARTGRCRSSCTASRAPSSARPRSSSPFRGSTPSTTPPPR